MSDPKKFLVTGSMGCIGAWALYHLVKRGETVVSFDLSENRHRLALLLSSEEQESIIFEHGDLSDFNQVAHVFEKHNITHPIHLAALQVPFCKANPVQGAQVNVVGMVNMLEAVRQSGLTHLAYASSIAVYGPSTMYPNGLIQSDAQLDPHTLYGAYKQANERTALVYWEDHQISSTGLRPYVVYGIGRDQGLTSDPTKAMLAAAKGEAYTINFGGVMQFQLASDVAQYFIEVAEKPMDGAYVFNLGGTPTSIESITQDIKTLRPDAKLDYVDTELPFPSGFDDRAFKKHFPNAVETPLGDGIQQTVEHFAACISDNQL